MMGLQWPIIISSFLITAYDTDFAMFYTLNHIFKQESIQGRGTIKGRGMIKGRHLSMGHFSIVFAKTKIFYGPFNLYMGHLHRITKLYVSNGPWPLPFPITAGRLKK
jgi:hypothetical protein